MALRRAIFFLVPLWLTSGLVSLDPRTAPLDLEEATAFEAFAEWAVGANESSEELLRKGDAGFGKLKEHMQEVCQTPDPQKGRQFRMALEPNHNVAYCIHNKAASSTIMRHLYKLQNPLDVRDAIWRRGRELELSPEKVGVHDVAMLNRYRQQHGTFVFSFVRHPFTRLVSAFINKVASDSDPTFKWLARLTNHSFVNFVDYVVHDFQHGKANIHWSPWFQHCDPCSMDFDFIGKVESFAEDMRYVVAKAGLASGHLEVGSVREVSSQGFEKSQHGERTRKYMNMLTQERKKKLFEFYRRDFELLGYSPYPYI